MSSFPKLRKLRLKRRLLRNQTRQSTAIRVSIMPSLGIMGRTTMPRRQRSPTGGQANFYINNCGDLRSLQPIRATHRRPPGIGSMTPSAPELAPVRGPQRVTPRAEGLELKSLFAQATETGGNAT